MFAAGAIAAGSALQYFGQRDANQTNRDIANATNAFNAAQAQLNRDWQERMSNTSWQRGVADMQKAGINPMLAVSQGGASTPSGSVIGGTTGAPQQNKFAGAANTALQAAQFQATLDNINADTKLKNANAANVNAQVPATTATSAFEASKYQALNDAVDIAKKFFGYDQNVNSAKTVASRSDSRTAFFSKVLDHAKRYGK